MNNIAIRLTNVSKKYEIHHEKPTLVEKFVKGKNETFWALKDINLTIRKGEKVGIIGPNGSGKTTLLKIIAGITSPTGGTVKTYGKVVSLIDLGAGFHEDLTGYQNIYLNGMLIGLHKRQVEANIRNIIAFADLKQFIDAPLFTYSSGMTLRLGFAIAVHADPDIFILDENISAGDIRFKKKSERKIKELFNRKKTILLVSHQLETVGQLCKRVMIINQGRIASDGTTKLIAQYKTTR